MHIRFKFDHNRLKISPCTYIDRLACVISPGGLVGGDCMKEMNKMYGQTTFFHPDRKILTP